MKDQKIYNMLFATIVMLGIAIVLILLTLHPIELKIEDCPAPKECVCRQPSCNCVWNASVNIYTEPPTISNITCKQESANECEKCNCFNFSNWTPRWYPVEIINLSQWPDVRWVAVR